MNQIQKMITCSQDLYHIWSCKFVLLWISQLITPLKGWNLIRMMIILRKAVEAIKKSWILQLLCVPLKNII